VILLAGTATAADRADDASTVTIGAGPMLARIRRRTRPAEHGAVCGFPS
jgi:hypothetical protein